MRDNKIRYGLDPGDDALLYLLARVAKMVSSTVIKEQGVKVNQAKFEYWLMARMADVLRDPTIADFLAWSEETSQIAT